MKIIDARVRIPYKSFVNAAIFKDPAAMDAWAAQFNMPRPPKVAGMDELFALVFRKHWFPAVAGTTLKTRTLLKLAVCMAISSMAL